MDIIGIQSKVWVKIWANFNTQTRLDEHHNWSSSTQHCKNLHSLPDVQHQTTTNKAPTLTPNCHPVNKTEERDHLYEENFDNLVKKQLLLESQDHAAQPQQPVIISHFFALSADLFLAF